MCIFAEFCLGFVPFTSTSVIASMVDTLGLLPEEWKGSYVDAERSQDVWYDPNTKPSSERSLKARIEEYCYDRDPVERQHVLSVLTRGFSYYPEERPTATQLLQDASFRAIMDNYGL